MKLLIGTLILSGTVAAFGQETTTAAPAAAARIAILPANGSDMIVASVTKNVPFTADESGESLRILPDGNRITDNWSGKIARNSQGHINRQVTSGNVGSRPHIFDGTNVAGTRIVAAGSGAEARYKVETETTATGRGYVLAAPAAAGERSVHVMTTTGHLDEAKRAELARAGAVTIAKEGTLVSAEGATRIALESRALTVAGVQHDITKLQTRKESLGTRDFGGVQADGTRVITTYLAGTVGNDRDIEVTSELWFSKELGVIVSSRRSDPRTGETSYQMTNIVRAEPDPSLFNRNK